MGAASVVEFKGSGRRRRRDFGLVKASERDLELFRFLGEQYALTIPQLARLIERSQRTARWLRDRWLKAAWVDSGVLIVGTAPFVWLTASGSRLAGLDYRVWQPNHALVPHIAAVNEVRILLERELELGLWICERALARTERSRVRPHVPDGVLVREGRRIAIEVELNRKSDARMEGILDSLSSRYEECWYFATPKPAAALRAFSEQRPWRKIRVCSHPPLPFELRAAA